MNTVLCNVTSVSFNYQDRGILVLDVFVDLIDGGSLSVFNLCLDTYNKDLKKRVGTAYGCEMLINVLRFFGVNDLHEIKNHHCYLLTEKDDIYCASDVLGLEQLPFERYSKLQQRIIKQDILNEFGESA